MQKDTFPLRITSVPLLFKQAHLSTAGIHSFTPLAPIAFPCLADLQWTMRSRVDIFGA